MKHIRTVVALALTFLLLSGCGAVPSAARSPGAAPPVAAHEKVTVNLGPSYEDCTDLLAHANGIVSDAGYNLSFGVSPLSGSYSEKQLNDYVDSLADLLQSQNSVAVVNEAVLKKLRAKGALGDIVPLAQRSAPDYSAACAAMVGDESDCLPASEAAYGTATRPAVIVRSDLWQRYGKKIQTASDYEDFLRWMKREEPDLIPGHIPTVEYLYAYNTVPLYDLFLPEYGYLPVDQFFIGGSSLCVKPGDTAHLLQTESLPEMAMIADRLKQWKTDGLVTITNAGSPSADPAGYASFLVNTADYIDNRLATNTPNRTDLVFDASGYTISILYPDLLPNMRPVGPTHYIVCGKGRDPAEFLRFLEDLNADADLYKSLLLGVEGEDYQVRSNGQIAALTTHGAYTRWSMLLSLHNDKFDRGITLAGVPENFNEALDALQEKQDANLDRYKKVLSELPDADYTEAQGTLMQRANACIAFLRSWDVSALPNWPSAKAFISLAEKEGQ